MDWGSAVRGVLAAYVAIDAFKKAADGRRRRRRLGDAEEDDDRRAPRSKLHNVHGIDQRVSHIVKLAQKGRIDPKVVTLARQTVSKKCGRDWCVPERNQGGEVSAIFHEVRQRIRYVSDAIGVDQFSSARRSMFEMHGEDCDGYSIALSSMLGAIGYRTRLRVIRTTDSPEWNHIYNLVELPRGSNKWIPLDASVNEPPGWEAPRSQIAAKRDYEVP
jgi:hypothetical protein